MTLTSTGDIIITGAFSNTLRIDTLSLTSAGYEDVFIAKLTANGRVLWAKSIGGPQHETASCVTVDPTGSIYVAGSFHDSAMAGTTLLRSRGGDEIFLAKYSKDGDFIWATSAGSIHNDYVGASSGGVGGGIAQDGRGHIYLTGSYGVVTNDTGYFGNLKITSRGQTDIFLVKSDTSGHFLWAKFAGGTSTDFSSDIKIDKNGSAYICGSFNAPWAYFDTTKITMKQGGYIFSDIFTAKYDSSGVLKWVRGAGNTSAGDGGGSLDLDSNANVYVTGSHGSDYLMFDNYTLHTNNLINGSNTPNSIFICKYTTNGDLDWAKGVGGYMSSGVSITCDKAGNSYTTGQTSQITIFDNDTLLNSTLFVTKYNKDGVVQWVSGNGGSGGGDGYATACNKNTGEVYLGGYYGGSAMSMGPVVFPATSVASMFVAKFSIATTGVPFISPANNPATAYPNPSAGTFMVSTGNIGYTELNVTNSLGQSVYRQSLQAFQKTQLISLPAEVSNGLYFIRLTGSGQRAAGNILIRR